MVFGLQAVGYLHIHVVTYVFNCVSKVSKSCSVKTEQSKDRQFKHWLEMFVGQSWVFHYGEVKDICDDINTNESTILLVKEYSFRYINYDDKNYWYMSVCNT